MDEFCFILSIWIRSACFRLVCCHVFLCSDYSASLLQPYFFFSFSIFTFSFSLSCLGLNSVFPMFHWLSIMNFQSSFTHICSSKPVSQIAFAVSMYNSQHHGTWWYKYFLLEISSQDLWKSMSIKVQRQTVGSWKGGRCPWSRDKERKAYAVIVPWDKHCKMAGSLSGAVIPFY